MPEEESNLVKKLENATKFSEEELKEVTKLREEYFKIQDQFGLLSISKIRLNEQLEQMDEHENSVHKQFKENQINEKKFLDEVTKKYGEGTLNPETGVFTKNNS
tara:strand:+ start:575 stop:886 length:312 start_codon:yes stop_codon:yes gene_type:complete